MATTPQHAQRVPTGARPKRRTVVNHRSRPPPRTRHSSHAPAPGNPDPLPLGLEPHDGHHRIRSSNSTGNTAEHLPRRTVGGKSGRSRRPVAAPATTAQQNAGTPRPNLTQTHRATPATVNNSGEEGGTKAGALNVEDSPSSSSTTTDSSSSTSATSGSPRSNVDTPAPEAATTSQAGPPSNPQRSPAPPNNNEAAMGRALRTLDQINLLDTLRQKIVTFATPPRFIRGRVRTALHFSLKQIQAAGTEQEQTRAWTLWFLLPRLLLDRPPGTRTSPKDVRRKRIQLFQDGEWQQTTAATSTAQPTPNARPKAQLPVSEVHLGELSAARQALTAAPPAPGTETTLAQLRGPARRPVEPYTPIPAHLAEFAPEQHVQIPAQRLLTALRRSRKGAAPGPSGLTADTLRLVLDDETTTNQFATVCNLLAQARIPTTIAKAIGMGRMVALQKREESN